MILIIIFTLTLLVLISYYISVYHDGLIEVYIDSNGIHFSKQYSKKIYFEINFVNHSPVSVKINTGINIYREPVREIIKKNKLSKVYIDKDGYLRTKKGKYLVHRLIMSKDKKRRLKREEVVHHKDGNKLNNKISNLYLCENQAQHEQIHKRNLEIYGSWHMNICQKQQTAS